MLIRPKDHIYWEPIFETQQEAEAFKDYWERVFVRGYVEDTSAVFSSPNYDTHSGKWISKEWLKNSS